MPKTSGVQLNSNHAINHFELKNAVLISNQPALLNGIFHFIKSDLVGVEIIYSGSWDKYRNSNLNLTDSFVILIPFKESETEIIAQISHFYELDIPVLLMHDSALDDSLKDILKIAPSVVVENNCSLDVLYTAFLEIIEKNFNWKSSKIRPSRAARSPSASGATPAPAGRSC
jgi:hypothetical protein